MANSGEVEAEYESEPEESVLLRRRSEASDDDKEVEEEENKMIVSARLNRIVRRIGYANESDVRDGAPEYYDDSDDEEVSYVDELEKLGEQVEEESEEEVAEQVTATKQRGQEKVNDGDNDAFAVPRIGAFYMHDDRFGGLRRRSRDQRRKNIWASKDELKWMHDKFEEMTLKETQNKKLNAFEVHRTSNDYHQNRNKNNTKSGGYKAKESRPHSKSGNNGSSSKIVKGRGPVRYKPLSRSISVNPPMKSMQLEKTQGTSSKTDSARVFSANNKQQSLGKTAKADSERALSTKSKQSAKSFEMTGDTDSSAVFSRKSKQSWDLGMASYTDPASVSLPGLNVDCDSLPFDQHLLAPSMSSYQQAFYPASSFHYDNSVTQKRMVQPGSRNAVFPASVLPNQIIHVQQANGFLQGNIEVDIPYAKEGVSQVAENYFTKLCFQYSVPGSTNMASPESRDQKTGSSLSIPFTYQATPLPNQLNRVSSRAQSIVQQVHADSTIQPPSKVFSQQLHSLLRGGSQKLYEASSLSFHEPGKFESLTGSIQSKVASLGIVSNITSPQYAGIQVMQFGGLHHGSLGGPAMDMNSTGYVGESQVHIRNPDLTWLPILPAAAGAVSATCHRPFIAPDGSCYGNLMTAPFLDVASYATHTSMPSNEGNTSGPSNGNLPPLETDYVKKAAEHMNNECGKQQFKPTRYSRMNIKE
ncbi:uncharacterized protein LOC111299084 isoform X2 [Durio zibethinus]|uniref:Uncharacterized protein LOC111299084 isoform X2 n=1 Tax=Durio zibethinus TaxID=66656 RepID=A0A6P5ZBD5_DURZI|nr:uncharacterized protein LOC111299084 isoform X2 [Durio zibethinus]